MTNIQAAQTVVETKSCHLIRERKDAPGQYDLKEAFTGNKRGWFYLDLFSASAITKVYEALNDDNKSKFAALPVERMARVAFRLVS